MNNEDIRYIGAIALAKAMPSAALRRKLKTAETRSDALWKEISDYDGMRVRDESRETLQGMKRLRTAHRRAKDRVNRTKADIRNLG